MIVLTGNVSRPKGEKWGMNSRDDLGMMVSPTAWRFPWTKYWACDNDVFAHSFIGTRPDPSWWYDRGETAWLKMLDKAVKAIEQGATRPLFCVLPDVVCDWRETVYRAWEYLPELRERNLPYAVALQNNEADDIEQVLESATLLYPHYFFVGGDTKWKWQHAPRIVEYGHACGIDVHIGRAGAHRQAERCDYMGADSCDGSKYMAFANAMMPPLLGVLNQTRIVF